MTDISKEYGTALFMLACEKNAKNEYARALTELEKAFTESPEYLVLLSSPAVTLAERLSAIEKAFVSLPEDVVSYLKLLCEKGRISCFFESAKVFRGLLEESEQKMTAKVTSAVPLTDKEKSALITKLETMCHKEISLETYIDETLLGGLLVELDGKVLDGTLKRRMRDVKEVMNQ